METVENFRTKKAVMEAVRAGAKVRVYPPPYKYHIPGATDGVVSLEGPHYPEPHRWYATATIQDGLIIKIK